MDRMRSVILKLLALAAFAGGIGYGGFLAYSALAAETDDIPRLALGLGLVFAGIFVIACIVPYIAEDYRHDETDGIAFTTALKTGLLFTFLSTFLIFGFIGIVLWAVRGLWQFGIAGIALILILIILAIEVSIRFQSKGSRQALKDKNAAEYTGKVTVAKGCFPIVVFRKIYLMSSFTVEIDGKRSEAKMRRNRLAKSIAVGDTVRVKFNPDKPRFCAILSKEESFPEEKFYD